MERRVLAYAHRGGSLEGPSSTLLAMRRALEAGANGLELDVHATADRHLVVCHDPTVDATTDAAGTIATMTLSELRSLDNAYWFVEGEGAVRGRDAQDYVLRGRAPLDPELRVPTLEEVLRAFPGVPLNLDIKQTSPAVVPYEASLAKLLADHGRGDDVIVASFLDAATAAFTKIAPEVPTSAGMLAVAQFWRAVRDHDKPPSLSHCALQVPVDFQGMTIVDEDLVAAAHGAGLAVHVWTIDEPEEMARLVGLGVDGIISDRPSVLRRKLEELGVAWKPGLETARG